MDHHIHLHARSHGHRRRDAHNMEPRASPSKSTHLKSSRVLLARSSSTCTSDSQAGCTKPTSTSTTTIVIAVVVPIAIALMVLFFLHRRHLRKLKEEDKRDQDKYKSLDFGSDLALGKKRGKKGPDMAMVDPEKMSHGRGTSLDLDMVGGPYILPATLQGSRESLHSLSRSTNDPHDPYRPVTFIKDDASIRSSGRVYRHDNSSMYTGSSGGTGRHGMNDGLIKNAQRMSKSFPHRAESLSPQDSIPDIQFPEPAVRPRSPLNPATDQHVPSPPPAAAPFPARVESAASAPGDGGYAAYKPTSPPTVSIQPASQPEPTKSFEQSAPVDALPRVPLPRIQSQTADIQSNPNTQSFMSESSYGDGFQITPPSPPHDQIAHAPSTGLVAPEPLRPHNDNVGLSVDDLGYDARRLSMSLRPLPPDDPSDNPEQRANRIRSFYKEYFDDSKPDPTNGQYMDYYEDYSSEYLDGAIFDPHSGAFVVTQPQAPYAQPVTRRAMTPPPRAPPRFRSGPNAGPGPRGGHMSGSSVASSAQYNRPRGMSSLSGRFAGPRKPLPPPSVLNSLPTPSKLTEDSMVFNATDFAPPPSFRELQNGRRPDSPLGTTRPYSPSIRPHTPLASSFDELVPMPSPHALRRSGTFTALDFAPPRALRDPDNASDAGSIRSNRSGISNVGRMMVRNGAYRVSRIPKDVVGTKDDIAASLRPKLDMVSPA